MTLDIYTGEFLICPVPLELTLNYCSYVCSYCFANLNQRQRRADMPKLYRLLDELEERRSVVAHFLQTGHPVCFSNRVDPFAASNIQQSVPLIEKLSEMGIPIQFQTRGPHQHHATWFARAFAALSAPTVWYVTIEMWDEELCRRIAPGAPSIQSRLDFIEFLVSEGHVVVVGLNPCVPDWLPGGHAEHILEAVHQRGAWGVWVERLHFSPYQHRQMTAREQSALGDSVIQRALRRETPADDRALLDRVRATAQAMGLEIFSVGQPNASNFFAPYHALFKTIPTLQDFINFCHARLEPGAIISVDQFVDFFARELPEGVWPIDCYFGSTAKQIWRTNEVPTSMTYRELLTMMFGELRYKMCPARLPSFAFAAEWHGDRWIQLVDDRWYPYLVWSPTGHSQYYCDVQTEIMV